MIVVSYKFLISIGFPKFLFKYGACNQTSYEYYNKHKLLLIEIIKEHFPNEIIEKTNKIGEKKISISVSFCELISKFSNRKFLKP